MRVRVVPERLYQRVTLERLLHESALDAASASMHHANFSQTTLDGRTYVLLDDRDHVARCKCVQIKCGFYRDVDRLVRIHARDRVTTGGVRR